MKESTKIAWRTRIKLRAEGDKLCAEGDKLRAEGSKLYAEGSKLCAEGDKLYAEGSKLCVEGDIQFFAAVITDYGASAAVQWTGAGCTIETDTYSNTEGEQ